MTMLPHLEMKKIPRNLTEIRCPKTSLQNGVRTSLKFPELQVTSLTVDVELMWSLLTRSRCDHYSRESAMPSRQLVPPSLELLLPDAFIAIPKGLVDELLTLSFASWDTTEPCGNGLMVTA